EAKGAAPIDTRIVLRAGEKNRRVDVTFPAPAVVPPIVPHRPPPIAAYVATAFAVAGIGTFAGFAIGGKLLENDRADTCGHRCTDDQVAPIRRDYAIADIALGVSVVATGVAIWLFASHASSKSRAGARPAFVF